MINNLVAASLCHKLVVFTPTGGLLKELQRVLIDSFWSGQHWLRAAVLFLPLQEGGQGRIDLESRVAAFRLQAAQRLLYHQDVCWREPACSLLRRGGRLGLDRHLFVLWLDSVDVAGCGRFYESVLAAWKLLRVSREWGMVPAQWVLEKPLFWNPSDCFGGIGQCWLAGTVCWGRNLQIGAPAKSRGERVESPWVGGGEVGVALCA